MNASNTKDEYSLDKYAFSWNNHVHKNKVLTGDPTKTSYVSTASIQVSERRILTQHPR